MSLLKILKRLQYITDSMEIVATGPPVVLGIRDHSEMPSQYRLVRDTYIIHAELDKSTNRPTVVFSLETKQGANLWIDAAPMRCYMYEDEIRAAEIDTRNYPADGVKLIWLLGRLPPPCDNVLPLSEVENVFVLEIRDASTGEKLADEEIRFSVKKNGKRIIYDSL